ncbi:MAG TPA: peroxide stress protein YaaA, partial [Bacteroidales bacterium]|nr:peroxide stress protein YaaA [Bacteroidales bacterium]
ARVITPVFKERHGNTYRMVTLFAKHARGSMARFIAKHCLSDVRDIQGYSENGYHFHPGLSDSHTWVFTRG